jgi:hypothetical protein
MLMLLLRVMIKIIRLGHMGFTSIGGSMHMLLIQGALMLFMLVSELVLMILDMLVIVNMLDIVPRWWWIRMEICM